jgi:hypothetical protein
MSVKDIVAGPEDNPLNDIPLIFEPRCKVCKSQFRNVIERLLVSGNSYVGIAKQFVNKDPEFETTVDSLRKSIERHRKAHLTIRDHAVRDILETKAREAGVLVETVRERIISEEALLQLAVAKGTEQLSDPDSRIKYQDAIKAAELLRDKKYEEISIQMDIVNRQYNAIVQACQRIVPKELYPQLVESAQAIFEGRTITVDSEFDQDTKGVREIVSIGS